MFNKTTIFKVDTDTSFGEGISWKTTTRKGDELRVLRVSNNNVVQFMLVGFIDNVVGFIIPPMEQRGFNTLMDKGYKKGWKLEELQILTPKFDLVDPSPAEEK